MNKRINLTIVSVVILLTVLSCKKEKVSVSDRIVNKWSLYDIRGIKSSNPEQTGMSLFYEPDSVKCINNIVTGYINGESFDYEGYYNDCKVYYGTFRTYILGSVWNFEENKLVVERNGEIASRLVCSDNRVLMLKVYEFNWHHSKGVEISDGNINVLWKDEMEYNLEIIEISDNKMILHDNDSNTKLSFNRVAESKSNT
ncbi:MAG: hypothetical protein N4A72_18080 [Bacteroidales bacterium]|jgi:hypothetical protein|nr:hypothetical protein [Bacteroidales bacterium]